MDLIDLPTGILLILGFGVIANVVLGWIPLESDINQSDVWTCSLSFSLCCETDKFGSIINLFLYIFFSHDRSHNHFIPSVLVIYSDYCYFFIINFYSSHAVRIQRFCFLIYKIKTKNCLHYYLNKLQ